MSCRAPAVLSDSPQGVSEVPGDGLDRGEVVHARLVRPGEFELAGLDRAGDLEQMRPPVGRIVVLTEGAVRSLIETAASLQRARVPLAEIVERYLRPGRVPAQVITYRWRAKVT